MRFIFLNILPILLLLSNAASAALQQHSFTVTGDNGETGSGNFVWDDTVVADGGILTEAEIISLDLQISGGNVVSGSTSFDESSCGIFSGAFTPDFAVGFIFECSNADNRIDYSVGPYTHTLSAAGVNSPVSVLTMVPGTTTAIPSTPTPTPTPVPALPIPLLGLLVAAILGFGLRRLRRG